MLLIGIALNRFTMTVLTLALPVLPFENFLVYAPRWQEWGPVVGIIAYAVLVYMMALRYLPLFEDAVGHENGFSGV